MENISASLVGKRVIALSDNNGLAQAIELNLSHRLKVDVVGVVLSEQKSIWTPEPDSHFDLIVVATSLLCSEPVVMLAQSSLIRQIGHIPVLIISDRPFEPDPDHLLFHQDFPLDAGELCSQVSRILEGSD